MSGGDHGRDGAGGGVGDGDPAELLVVEGLEVEGLVKLLLEAGTSGEQVAEDDEGVKQSGVAGAGVGLGEVG